MNLLTVENFGELLEVEVGKKQKNKFILIHSCIEKKKKNHSKEMRLELLSPCGTCERHLATTSGEMRGRCKLLAECECPWIPASAPKKLVAELFGIGETITYWGLIITVISLGATQGNNPPASTAVNLSKVLLTSHGVASEQVLGDGPQVTYK